MDYYDEHRRDYLADVRPLSPRALEILNQGDDLPLLLADRLYVAREIRRAKRAVKAARERRDAALGVRAA